MMNKHLDEILRTIEEAQRQIAELMQNGAVNSNNTEEYQDAEQGLAWVKKKLEKLKTAKIE